MTQSLVAAPSPTDTPGPHGEFEDRPVPLGHRRSLLSVSAVWFGFPMILTNTVFGGVIVHGLGLVEGLGAMAVGNLLLLLYVGALSHLAGRTGENFALTAARTFGARGKAVAGGFLATVVVGWFAFQIGLTGATLHSALGWNTLAVTIGAGALYTAVTALGIRALSVLGLVAAPLFLAMAAVALGLAFHASHSGSVLGFSGTGGLGFGAAVTMVFAGWADSGTMTGDFTRWAGDGRSAVAAAFSAFPVANAVSLVVGGLVVALGAAAHPDTDGGDFLPLLTTHGGLLTAVAVVFVFVNLGSVASHCLYNAAIGWSALLRSRMQLLTVALGVVGTAAAAAGVWTHFSTWLSLLGVFVPPIGAVLITDQVLLRRETTSRDWQLPALASWAIGAAAAWTVHEQLPALPDAVAGLAVGMLAQAAFVLAGRR
ncbi:cytosine permease [Streptacidiphilus sp. N1-10]|uniref:Cytosine permease n=1 Tax=Streptacidiphilus jeojiensis TaxID=3229225 RepID=A0ABV6XGM9_9ACTN